MFFSMLENNRLELRDRKLSVPAMAGFFSLALVCLLALAGCGATPGTQGVEPSLEAEEPRTSDESSVVESSDFLLQSTAFEQGGSIPEAFSCDGEDLVPPLSWDNEPEGTEAYALIMEDPDAPGGIWVHWVVYNLPGEVNQINAGSQEELNIPVPAEVGKNSWGERSYGGPCPPSGTHRYFFNLFALDTLLEVKPGADRKELLEAMEGHSLGEAQLMGTFSR